MANKTQIIDVTRSAVITDPEAFYENLMSTGQEDSPERTIPIVAYEGYNFLPTLYGYRSYFDTTATLDISALGSRCDTLVLYQFANYSNVLVALCEDGIWTNSGGSTSEAWVHKVTLAVPSPGSYLAWTYCVIENVLYMYRQGNGSVYKLTPTAFGPVTIASFVPSFLNMAGQMGIFRANGRLGFWDSANSVSWSSLFDFTDFTPAIITLAANAIFNDVLGRIVHVQSFGSGFIIYSTKNIVGAQFNTTGSILFSAKSISEQAGIWTSKQVCQGATDMEHFAYTNTGIKRVKGDYTVEDIFVGIYDFLRESRDPVYLSFLQGRYLFLSVIDPAYISGHVSFEVVSLGSLTIRLLFNGLELTNPADVPLTINGIPFQDDLINQVLQGSSVGLYTQWQASGSKMALTRRSPMSPYVLDDPLTPEDETVYIDNTDPLITPADLILARDTAVLSNPISINNATPSLLDLGWTISPSTGLADRQLAQFKTRQLREWSETKLLMDQLKYYIQVIMSEATVETLLPTEYTTKSQAETARPSNTTNVDTDLITMPYRQSVGFPVETFLGVGTGTPTWEYKTPFDIGLKVTQRKSETYTAAPMLFTYLVGSAYTFGEGGAGTFVKAVDPSSLDYVAIGSTLRAATPGFETYGTVSYDSTFASIGQFQLTLTPAYLNVTVSQWAALKAHAESTYLSSFPDVVLRRVSDDATFTFTYSHTTIGWYDGPGRTDYTIHYHVPEPLATTYRVSTTVLASVSLLQVGGDPSNPDVPYGLWKVLKSSLNKLLVAETPVTMESKTYATQENLDWGIYTPENPPLGFDFPTNAQVISIPDFSLQEGTRLPQHLDVTFPGATFLLQDATISPIFPDYHGALVYDTGLQKWGKCKATYTALVDYSPINSNHDQIISYTNFGMDSGVLKSDGTVRLFSSRCTDSFIRYGKLAFSRQGYTYPEEVQVHFRRPFTGIIGIDASLDSRSIHSEFHEEEIFAGVGLARLYPAHAGKWYTISLGGEFDLRSIEFTGRISGIR